MKSGAKYFSRRDATAGRKSKGRSLNEGFAKVADTVELRRSVEEGLLNAGAPMYAADTSGKLIYANDAYRKLLAASKPPPGSKGGGRDIVSRLGLERVVREGVPCSIDESIRLNDKLSHFHAHHFPITGRGDAVVAVGGVYYNSSAERKINERVAQLQARFDDITRLVSDWVWESDREFKLTYLSARVTEFFGIHPRLILGSSLFDVGVFNGGGPDIPDQSRRTPFRDKTFRVVGYDGKVRLCLLSGMPIFDVTSGTLVGYRGTGTDITERVQAEERALRAQAQLYEAIETSSEGFALFDAEDCLVVCNSK